MFEGHAPYKPRYVLPDYLVFWRTVPNGWSWKARKTLIRTLSADHSLPPCTVGHIDAVYLGQLDALLQPYVRILTQDRSIFE